MEADATRDFIVPLSACSVPTTAQAYVTNATVVPPGVFGFLTLWAEGQNRPTVSTQNAIDGALTSNASIIPASGSGGINVYTSNVAHLLLDISGYFAPKRESYLNAFDLLLVSQSAFSCLRRTGSKSYAKASLEMVGPTCQMHESGLASVPGASSR